MGIIWFGAGFFSLWEMVDDIGIRKMEIGISWEISMETHGIFHSMGVSIAIAKSWTAYFHGKNSWKNWMIGGYHHVRKIPYGSFSN